MCWFTGPVGTYVFFSNDPHSAAPRDWPDQLCTCIVDLRTAGRLIAWVPPTFSRALSEVSFRVRGQSSNFMSTEDSRSGSMANLSTIPNLHRPGNYLVWPVRKIGGSSDGCSGSLGLESKQGGLKFELEPLERLNPEELELQTSCVASRALHTSQLT